MSEVSLADIEAAITDLESWVSESHRALADQMANVEATVADIQRHALPDNYRFRHASARLHAAFAEVALGEAPSVAQSEDAWERLVDVERRVHRRRLDLERELTAVRRADGRADALAAAGLDPCEPDERYRLEAWRISLEYEAAGLLRAHAALLTAMKTFKASGSA